MLKLSAEDLTNRAIRRRAVELVNLGMPVVRYNRMYDAMVSAGGAFNKIAYVCVSRPRKAGPHDSENCLDALTTEVCSPKDKLTSADQRGTMRTLSVWRTAMPLRRGEVQGYDFNRMVVEFTMLNRDKVIQCAISTTAMDDLEGKHDVKPHQRVDQFMRLREVIEEQASRKFFDEQVRLDRPVILRSNDFSIVASLRRPHHS